eukprot:7713000-Lingulodinium_polyedra.AAC.1
MALRFRISFGSTVMFGVLAGTWPGKVHTAYRAELMAAVQALEQVHEQCAMLCVDSGYVAEGCASMGKGFGRANNQDVWEKARLVVAIHDR